MRVRCFCRRYLINPENATYVRNGIPLCHEQTCAKVKEHREAMDLRRVPYFDEEEGELRREEMRELDRRSPRSSPP